MKKSDRRKRAAAFYLSALLFLILLPIILSYALGYKIDFIKFKIYKTGIIYVNSRPTGASIYLNGKLHTDLTPAQIEELKPGTYKLEVKRDGFYSWERELIVKPNMVTRADSIVLFPVIKDMKRVAECAAPEFVISDKKYIYYMSKTGLFRSTMDGSGLKKLSSYSDWPEGIIGKRVSAGDESMIYFTAHDLYVVYLNPSTAFAHTDAEAKIEEIIKTPDQILDAFWYSGAGYIILVTTKSVEVIELRGEKTRNIISLYKFTRAPKCIFYDEVNDSLYFTDSAETQKYGDDMYLYRLDLRQKFFDKFMKLLVGKSDNEEK